MTSELKPCPFCGKCPTARSRMAGENEGYETTFIIRCECGSQFLAKDDLNKLGWVDAKGKAAKCKAVEGWNTRATPSVDGNPCNTTSVECQESPNLEHKPDVPELVRYGKEYNGGLSWDIIKKENGEYVLYSQSAEIIAADRASLEQAKKEINTLLVSYVREHFFENKTFQPLDSLIGQISQLDNAITITRDFKNRAEAAEAELAQIKAQEPVAWVDASGIAAFGLGGVSTVHTQFETKRSERFRYPLYAALSGKEPS